jgi:hypothetical protein
MKYLNYILAACLMLSISCGDNKTPEKEENKEKLEIIEPAISEEAPKQEEAIADDSELEGIKKSQIKSGIITYETSGFATGEQTLYFDNWGFDNTIIQTMTQNGQTMENKIILSEEWIYQMNLTEKRYMKVRNISNDIFKKLYKKYKDNEIANDSLMTVDGGKLIGMEKIMGKECKIWTLQNAKSWMWKGIILKSEMSLPFGQLIFTAKDIQLDAKMPKDIFKVPTDINFVEQKIR